VSPEREPSLAMGWCDGLVPRCQGVKRDACYSRADAGTHQCFAHWWVSKAKSDAVLLTPGLATHSSGTLA